MGALRSECEAHWNEERGEVSHLSHRICNHSPCPVSTAKLKVSKLCLSRFDNSRSCLHSVSRLNRAMLVRQSYTVYESGRGESFLATKSLCLAFWRPLPELNSNIIARRPSVLCVQRFNISRLRATLIWQVLFSKGCFVGIPVLLASAKLEITGLPGWIVATTLPQPRHGTVFKPW